MSAQIKMSTETPETSKDHQPAAVDATVLGLISSASFWFPLRTSVGSGWAEHAPFAFWLIDALRPTTIVELGSYKGYSFAAFCQAVHTTRIPSRCYAADTWRGDEHAGLYSDEVYDELLAYINEYYGSFARLIRSTFDEALPHFDDGSVDLLHIDGRHFYEDALHDFTSWLPKLATNAIVLFHDINVRERGFGIHRLWEELKEKHSYFEFFHGNGLGILAIGSEFPDQIRRLLKLSEDPQSAGRLRDIYNRLGKATSNHYEIASLRDEIASLREDIVELARQKGAFEGGVRERDDIIIAFRQQVAELIRQNNEYEAGITYRILRRLARTLRKSGFL